MRTMYDSVNVDRIPSSATMVAGYVDGQYRNIDAMRARFPHIPVITIATEITSAAIVLDCEKGDATPDQCPPWATRQRALGGVPTVYCSASVWPAVQAAFTAQKVAQPLYGIAHYDNVAELIPGAIYKQYGGVINQYDLNAVADFWPGVDPEVEFTMDQIMLALALFFKPGAEPGDPAHTGEGYGRIVQLIESPPITNAVATALAGKLSAVKV